MEFDYERQTYFKLPIEYIDKNIKLEENINDDLELTKTNNEKDKPIYNLIFEPSNKYENNLIHNFSKNYTNDIKFLKENQKMIQKLNNEDYEFVDLECIDSIVEDNNFIQKYNYIDIKYFYFLNNSEWVLQIISIFSLLSPIFSLIMPIFGIILPYFVMKLKGVNISINEYYTFVNEVILKKMFANTILNFNQLTLQNKIYSLFSCFMYFMQIYNNIRNCFRFHENMSFMCNNLTDINNYLKISISNIRKHKKIIENYSKFKPFYNELTNHEEILIEFNDFIMNSPEKWSLNNLFNIGYIMKCFYIIYNEKDIQKSFYFSFYFNAYLKLYCNLKNKIVNKTINYGKYNTSNKVSFKELYYTSIDKSKAIKNNINLSNNNIITGPNASGKTTIIKSVLLNTILLQSIGVGYFKSATLHPFDSLFCYLNIPDTSGRDSLFQAEAKRCLEIINYIKENNNQRIFCIFDELYSGTNPDEAIASATSFIEYLNKYKVSFLLTTHFTTLCKNIENSKQIKNYKMQIEEKNNDFVYLYKLLPGISDKKGAIKVLNDLKYPQEILENTKKYLQ
tara:strand:+ start:11745 stop:13439 length:1695 start_codon:yes stop_codon:yes gene_type:complete